MEKIKQMCRDKVSESEQGISNCQTDSQVRIWLYGVAAGEGEIFNVVETIDDGGDG